MVREERHVYPFEDLLSAARVKINGSRKRSYSDSSLDVPVKLEKVGAFRHASVMSAEFLAVILLSD